MLDKINSDLKDAAHLKTFTQSFAQTEFEKDLHRSLMSGVDILMIETIIDFQVSLHPGHESCGTCSRDEDGHEEEGRNTKGHEGNEEIRFCELNRRWHPIKPYFATTHLASTLSCCMVDRAVDVVLFIVLILSRNCQLRKATNLR